MKEITQADCQAVQGGSSAQGMQVPTPAQWNAWALEARQLAAQIKFASDMAISKMANAS